jgi:(E)-4-hydroxy-3-methyl-but-2-enyl pyrophosphate reductase
MKIEIIKGEYGGFCFGVKRAYEMVLKEIEKSEQVQIMGKLAHNNELSLYLINQGVTEIDDINQVDKGTIVFTAHGAKPIFYQQAKAKKLKIVDTTCPKVMNVQKLAKEHAEKTEQVIIFGDKNHKEVKNIQAWSTDSAIVVGSLPEVEKIRLEDEKRYCLVSQTTQNSEDFEAVKNFLESKLKDRLSFYNTICPSASLRQAEARKLAKEEGIMIIIGGKMSANSRRLYDIAKKINTKSYFIENEKELQAEWLDGVERVSVIAGASTLDLTIERVVQRINKFNQEI